MPELLAGYLHPVALGAEIARYLAPPELGDSAGVLGAVALARDLSGAAIG